MHTHLQHWVESVYRDSSPITMVTMVAMVLQEKLISNAIPNLLIWLYQSTAVWEYGNREQHTLTGGGLLRPTPLSLRVTSRAILLSRSRTPKKKGKKT